ncbi:MAG: hypothetical protein OET90_09920 [Desulfuromonadales bacterium]|nr:hypothetical protein [Desulfuromonadales bacterium]
MLERIKSAYLSEDEWEKLCRRCGRCCYEKIDFEGQIYYTAIPCEFLDVETRLCKVYPDRDTARPGCVRLDPDTAQKGFLPVDCPYVADSDDYVAPTMPEDDEDEL